MSRKGRDGYYDKEGVWHRTKFCFMYCGSRCTCSPPLGISDLNQLEDPPSCPHGIMIGCPTCKGEPAEKDQS